jgi:hypothetical protein
MGECDAVEVHLLDADHASPVIRDEAATRMRAWDWLVVVIETRYAIIARADLANRVRLGIRRPVDGRSGIACLVALAPPGSAVHDDGRRRQPQAAPDVCCLAVAGVPVPWLLQLPSRVEAVDAIPRPESMLQVPDWVSKDGERGPASIPPFRAVSPRGRNP